MTRQRAPHRYKSKTRLSIRRTDSGSAGCYVTVAVRGEQEFIIAELDSEIRKIRLKNSLRLLMEEGHNISEAAYASGFNDLGYFRSCFREEYGMAPSEYIRLRKSQD